MKDIKGYEGLYQINEKGEVYSVRSKSFRKPYKQKNGYMAIDFHVNGVRTKHLIHRLVATTFLENPDNLPQVDHIDNNPENNSLENLRWTSIKDNVYKSYSTMPPLRNFRKCELWNRDGFIKDFNSIMECGRYCRDILGLSYTSMIKYRKYRDYIIKCND